jgi:hypothetical protein
MKILFSIEFVQGKTSLGLKEYLMSVISNLVDAISARL